MRKDALQRREALVSAAADLFTAEGYTVSLDRIAAQAGVGRGTLYRNFADREELALAVFERGIEAVERIAADGAGDLADLMTRLARAGAPTLAVYVRIGAQLAQVKSRRASFEQLNHRLIAALTPAVTQARARGEVRQDLTPQTLALGTRMLGGFMFLLSFRSDPLETELVAAVDLLMQGLAPRPPR